ncbi:DUF3944 domain-containing protein [Helicobacter pylori]|nr:DUF3944 domain-containing protein [Helicobacter pylori]
MAYRYDSDLEFLKRLSSNDLKDLFDVLVYDEDGTLRMNEELTSSTKYKMYGNDYAKYPERIAEELQHYGGNSFANFFRGEGVLYKEILCDVCDHLKVSYNEKSNTSLIEENMLAKLLKDSLEQMSKKDLEELCHELGMTNINKMIGENKQVLTASVLTLFKTGGSHSYPLAIAVADTMVKKTLGHGLTAVAGKVALKKISGILAGPAGWIIAGVLASINLAGPAYRVTVPACFVIAALRRKPKQINKTKTNNNKGGKGIFIFIFLVILVIFSPIIFFPKKEHQPNNNASNSQESGVKKLKNPSHKN